VNLLSQFVVSLLLLILMLGILRSFIRHGLGSSQVLFWFSLLAGAQILTWFPQLVDRLSLFWGNLLPVSWISFMGLLVLTAYLLYQSTQINSLQSRVVGLVRELSFLEQRLREERVEEDG